MDFLDIVVSILGSTIRLSIPLIFTALAGLFSERAGVFDIGLEGKMLMAAFTAASVAYATGSAWLGLLAGIGGSLALSLMPSYSSRDMKGSKYESTPLLSLSTAVRISCGFRTFVV